MKKNNITTTNYNNIPEGLNGAPAAVKNDHVVRIDRLDRLHVPVQNIRGGLGNTITMPRTSQQIQSLLLFSLKSPSWDIGRVIRTIIS